MNQFLFELKEVHPECGTHYEFWWDHGPVVYCPKCDKWWEPCESAMRQYREWNEMPLAERL